MAGLQRSSGTFRRSGSSGLVWDDKYLSGEIKPASGDGDAAAARVVEQSQSSGHGVYRAAGRVPPALDPPSPRVALCGFCRFFGVGKGKNNGNAKAKSRRH